MYHANDAIEWLVEWSFKQNKFIFINKLIRDFLVRVLEDFFQLFLSKKLVFFLLCFFNGKIFHQAKKK